MTLLHIIQSTNMIYSYALRLSRDLRRKPPGEHILSEYLHLRQDMDQILRQDMHDLSGLCSGTDLPYIFIYLYLDVAQ